MPTHEKVPSLIQAQDGPSQAAVMHSHILGMGNRHAQNHVLNSILQKSGRDTPEGLDLSHGTDEEDIVDVDLRIRKKIEYVCDQMDKASASERAVSESRGILSLPSEINPGADFWTTAPAKGHLETNTWEPPSPAKSIPSGRCWSPGEDGPPSETFAARSESSQYTENESRAPTAELEPQSCAISQTNFLSTVIYAAPDTRNLVLLWYQGLLGPIPGDGETFPALLTLDQLDEELLSTKLEPKECVSLLYDLEARLGESSLKDMELKQCCLCEESKLWLSEPSKTLKVLHEFPLWKTQRRCAHKVCTTCTVKHMLGAFDDALWMAPGGVKFHCPILECSKYLGQFPKGGTAPSFSVVLPMKDRVFMDACYKMLMELKSIIKEELPNLSAESRAMGEQTASVLRKDGYMMAVAEATKNPRLLQLDGGATIASMSASSDSTYEIPVLVKLLKRETRPRRCVCCRGNLHEVKIQDPRQWRKTTSQCVGQGPHSPTVWGLHLMSFPLEFNGGCVGHPFICAQCLRASIGSDKESIKKDTVEIHCPSWGCHYKLRHGEIRACLSPSVREVYDWAYTNSELVATPGFVWCSEPGCARGQVCGGSEPESCQSCGGSLCSGQSSE